jgi:ribosomal protein S18 acetylase RimI-like enzyme
MLRISELKTPPSLELFSELVELLQDAVSSGASIGWIDVPDTKEARNYWTEVLEAVGRGERALFVATDNHVCAGAVQLSYAQRPNSRHRAEVQKLMVHSQYRRRGIGRALLAALETAALAHKRSLLILDVRSGDAAEKLYASAGYKRVGEIPGYVSSPGGSFDPTTIYFRQLSAAAASR